MSTIRFRIFPLAIFLTVVSTCNSALPSLDSRTTIFETYAVDDDQQPSSAKQYRDPQEYLLISQITKTANPSDRLQLLASWATQYPSTDFAFERLNYFAATLKELAATSQAERPQLVEECWKLLKLDPTSFEANYAVSLYGPSLGGEHPSAELVNMVETSATAILAGLDEHFDASKMPPSVTPEAWHKSKLEVDAAGQNAMHWVSSKRKDLASSTGATAPEVRPYDPLAALFCKYDEQKPEIVSQGDYPRADGVAKPSPNIILNAIIDTEGQPQSIIVVRSLELDLYHYSIIAKEAAIARDRAIEALRQCRFRPATVCGRPVATKVSMRVTIFSAGNSWGAIPKLLSNYEEIEDASVYRRIKLAHAEEDREKQTQEGQQQAELGRLGVHVGQSQGVVKALMIAHGYRLYQCSGALTDGVWIAECAFFGYVGKVKALVKMRFAVFERVRYTDPDTGVPTIVEHNLNRLVDFNFFNPNNLANLWPLADLDRRMYLAANP